MKKYTKILVSSVVMVLATGCMTTLPTFSKGKKSEAENSSFITMKTPVFRYADQGFIQKKAGATKVEIYANGSPAMKLEISSSQICSGSGLFSCMSKGEFNKRYLSPSYPDDTLENIFQAKPIFASSDLKQTGTGFIQMINKDGEYKIRYSVSGTSISLHDITNRINIRVRENK